MNDMNQDNSREASHRPNPCSQANPCGCSSGATQPPTHFVGIGGAGMSAIAQVLRAAGCRVQGSDRSESPTVEMLRRAGIPVFIGHDAANIGEMERVVYTRAVSPDNPELIAAREAGIPVIERAEMLGRLYDLFQNRVSITGTHGKTTTSAMVGVILTRLGQSPTVLIGGEVPDLEGHGSLGVSSTVVAEACEAYSSFLHLKSSLAIVTNIDVDHLDHYGTFEGVLQGFRGFLENVDPTGTVIAWGEDPNLLGLRADVPRRWITYGFSGTCDYQLEILEETRLGQRFCLRTPDTGTVEVWLPMNGRHFALNASAAIIAAVCLGNDIRKAAEALAGFRGVARRMELKGVEGDVTVVDDYAHHPTEIEATLKAALVRYGQNLTVVFQPHLYSRTADLLEDFASALFPAPRLVLTDVYSARELPSAGVETDALFEALQQMGHPDLHYVPALQDIPFWLEERVLPGDTVLTVGAGDVFTAGENLLRILRTATEAAR